MVKLSIICLLCSQGVLFQKHTNQYPQTSLLFLFDKHFFRPASIPLHSLGAVQGCTACPFLLATQFQHLLLSSCASHCHGLPSNLLWPVLCEVSLCPLPPTVQQTLCFLSRPHSPTRSTASPSLTDEDTEVRRGEVERTQAGSQHREVAVPPLNPDVSDSKSGRDRLSSWSTEQAHPRLLS